jgi:sulfur-oxidizing protein SoxY
VDRGRRQALRAPREPTPRSLRPTRIPPPTPRRARALAFAFQEPSDDDTSIRSFALGPRERAADRRRTVARAGQAGPFNTAAFEAKSLADALKAFGAGAPAESKDVTLTAPDIAENGAVVPVGAATTLPNAKQLLILVEKNPNALAASFGVTPAIEANVQTRVKMGQSSNVYAVAITEDGKAFFAQKEVKVTLGGCGG